MSSAGSPDGPRLRVVRGEDPLPRRRPGPAVIAVLVYALLFAAALWYFRVRWLRAPAHPAAGPPIPAVSSGRTPDERTWLLAGAGLAPADRARLRLRLAGERCDCGCELTLQDCLAQDRSCARSPEIARSIAGVPR